MIKYQNQRPSHSTWTIGSFLPRTTILFLFNRRVLNSIYKILFPVYHLMHVCSDWFGSVHNRILSFVSILHSTALLMYKILPPFHYCGQRKRVTSDAQLNDNFHRIYDLVFFVNGGNAAMIMKPTNWSAQQQVKWRQKPKF